MIMIVNEKTLPCHILFPFLWHAFLQISFLLCAYLEAEKIGHYRHAQAECWNILIHYVLVFPTCISTTAYTISCSIIIKLCSWYFGGKVIWTVFRQHSISVNYLTFPRFTCICFKSRVACFLICYLRQSCWD